MYYYAEAHGQNVTEDIYAGGFLMHEAGSQPYCDLWRFDTKDERDAFVAESTSHNSITKKDALLKHKDQFEYWAHN